MTTVKFTPGSPVYWRPVSASEDPTAWTLIGHIAAEPLYTPRRAALHSEYHRRQKRRRRS